MRPKGCSQQTVKMLWIQKANCIRLFIISWILWCLIINCHYRDGSPHYIIIMSSLVQADHQPWTIPTSPRHSPIKQAHLWFTSTSFSLAHHFEKNNALLSIQYYRLFSCVLIFIELIWYSSYSIPFQKLMHVMWNKSLFLRDLTCVLYLVHI